MSAKARLAGTRMRPELHVKSLDDGMFATVRQAGGVHDDDAGYWVVPEPGPSPASWLSGVGALKYSVAIDGVADLAEVTAPLAGMSRGQVLVLPRLMGRVRTAGLLAGLDATFDDDRGGFVLPLWQARFLAGESGVDLSRRLAEIVEWLPGRVAELAASDSDEGFDDVVGVVGGVPEWFGLELDPYQRAGAIAATGGHRMICDEMGLGKGSPKWEKLLTPSGWTTYGQVEVGDEVIGSDGTPTKVTGVFDRGELKVYLVKMSDGSSVTVDGDHLWQVSTAVQRWRTSPGRVVSTRELADGSLTRISTGKSANKAFIPMVEPVEFEYQEPLPLDPYVFGVLLGDGCLREWPVSFSSADHEMAALVDAALPDGVWVQQWESTLAGSGSTPTWSVRTQGSSTNPVQQALIECGLAECRSYEKWVPELWLFSSPGERLELLRGLMDSDGTCSKGGLASFSSVSERLAQAVRHLVMSLGGVARLSTRTTTYTRTNGDKASGRLSYRVTIKMPVDVCPFKLSRKAELWRRPNRKDPTRSIVSVEPAGRDEIVCISVDAQDSLYVTSDFIVTHNTRQALAAAAIVDAQRIVVVCPPVVVTSWSREVEASHVADPDRQGPGQVVTFLSGRKEPDIPDVGVVIVPDTLLAAREHLIDDLGDWEPQVVIVDEIHRAKTWTAQRSRAVRSMCDKADMVLGLTGTPLFANPVELASPLDATGLLEPVFGGYGSYTKAFARKNRFKAWEPRKRELPRLRRMLGESVWVRRVKADVMSELPPKRRSPLWVNVDLKGFRDAHSEVADKVDTWLDRLGREPTEADIEDFCKGDSAIGLLSPLRRAAGMAKVDAAVKHIIEHVMSTTEETPDGKVFHRPLIVWTHHKEVSDAMAEAVPKAVGSTQVIVGSTSATKRGEIVDMFQEGRVSVLVASIHAAGVGITLTRSSDMLFVETDWTPALVAQAEDRSSRRGQQRPVQISTMIAFGTLDEQIQKVLGRKIGFLDDVMGGGDHSVAVGDLGDERTEVSQIIEGLVTQQVARRFR